jgi:hypothetical protein
LAGITVVGPEIGATLRGTVTFEWRDASGFALGPGEQYELIFWTPGQDPMVSGLSPVGASNDKVKTFDLAQFESLLGLTPGGSYFWGVRLWDGSRAVRMLSEARSFIYERTGGGSSGGGVPPTHEPPPP